jgi:hypothetical protein
MNPKAIDHVCSRLVYVFHWRNVGSKDRIIEMPHVSTRLADLGETISKQLVNWGYAVWDRACGNITNTPRSRAVRRPLN